MAYDVYSVRGLYTTLSEGWTYLNAHATPQVPERVAVGVARAFRNATSVSTGATGSHSQRQHAGRLEGDVYIENARGAVADLLGVRADRVVLGSSLPVLYQSLARAMEPMLARPGTSVVLSGLDAPEVSAPFSGLVDDTRWALPDLATGELPAFQYKDLVDGHTRFVALSAAHDLLGTVAPVSEIVEHVRSRSRAWTLVDVSSIAMYRPIVADDWDCNILAIDLAQIGGPQLAALVFRDTAMFKRIAPISPTQDCDTYAKLESPFSAGLAGGVDPAVDHVARLGSAAAGSRRKRVQQSMAELDAYMARLTNQMYTFLGTLPAAHIVGVTGEAAAGSTADRLPRLSFAVHGVPAATVHQRLFDNGLVTTIAPNTPLLENMGVGEIGGAVTISAAPFNTEADIAHLTRVVASLA